MVMTSRLSSSDRMANGSHHATTPTSTPARGSSTATFGLMAEMTMPVAIKEYKCDGACGKPILKGERYIKEASPPWEDFEGDVDDDGRPIAILREESERKWYITRYHEECHYEAKL